MNIFNAKQKIILIAFITIFVAGCGMQPKITMAKYNQVQDGMGYSNVCSIMGENGQEMSSSSMPGVPGMIPSITTKAYGWQNPEGSNTIIMFQNDKMVMKSQFGLK